jgi:hypothetical protein
MTAATLEKANDALRAAVKDRLDSTDPSDDKLVGYRAPPLAGCEPAQRCAAEVLAQAWRGDSVMRDGTHPTSQKFYDLCDSLKAMHARKSSDYGSSTDPLANIRNGAEFVGIESWKGAMVRLSDKVTRLATYNRTGSLEYEGVEDTLLDLASYALLALLLYKEEQGG